jgi:hypothetical protein
MVEFIDGSAWASGSVPAISVEAGPSALFVEGDFIVDSSRTCALLYFGADSALNLPSSFRVIGVGCFACRDNLASVRFDPGAVVTQIEAQSFEASVSLTSFCVPATVEILGAGCFRSCERISEVKFETPSRLREIEAEAFRECGAGVLASIRLPASVEIPGKFCFAACHELKVFAFEANSRLRRIEEGVFSECRALEMLRLPAAIEVLAPHWDVPSSIGVVTFPSVASLRRMIENGTFAVQDGIDIEIEIGMDDAVDSYRDDGGGALALPGYAATILDKIPRVISIRKSP